jgi:hypothetical protein
LPVFPFIEYFVWNSIITPISKPFRKLIKSQPTEIPTEICSQDIDIDKAIYVDILNTEQVLYRIMNKTRI